MRADVGFSSVTRLENSKANLRCAIVKINREPERLSGSGSAAERRSGDGRGFLDIGHDITSELPVTVTRQVPIRRATLTDPGDAHCTPYLSNELRPQPRCHAQSELPLDQIAERIGDMRQLRVGLVQLGTHIAVAVGLPYHTLEVPNQSPAARIDEQSTHSMAERGIQPGPSSPTGVERC